MYSAVVMEHFHNPRNAGRLERPDVTGSAGNPEGLEFVNLYFHIREGRVSQCRFETLGCGATIATCSVLTEWVTGKTIQEARDINAQELLEMLGGLPYDKLFCSELALGSQRNALEDYACLTWELLRT